MKEKVAVLFSYNDRWLSRLIRAFTKDTYSHVAIKIDDHTILDARFPGGVQERPLDYVPQSIIWMELDMDKAKSCIGSRYDLKKFFWYGFRIGKPWNVSSQYLCSEVIAYAADNEFMENMRPDEIFEYELQKVPFARTQKKKR